MTEFPKDFPDEVGVAKLVELDDVAGRAGEDELVYELPEGTQYVVYEEEGEFVLARRDDGGRSVVARRDSAERMRGLLRERVSAANEGDSA